MLWNRPDWTEGVRSNVYRGHGRERNRPPQKNSGL